MATKMLMSPKGWLYLFIVGAEFGCSARSLDSDVIYLGLVSKIHFLGAKLGDVTAQQEGTGGKVMNHGYINYLSMKFPG